MADGLEVGAVTPPELINSRMFNILNQDVEFFVDFSSQILLGKTTLKVQVLSKELKVIRLRARQMDIKSVRIDSFPVSDFSYQDPYRKFNIRQGFTVKQHHIINSGFERKWSSDPEDMELSIPLSTRSRHDWERLSEFEIHIEFSVYGSRDGLQWVGVDDNDFRYPHVYTYSNSLLHTQGCLIFPCVDLPSVRSTWNVTIDCPRTLGDLISTRAGDVQARTGTYGHHSVNGATSGIHDAKKDQAKRSLTQFSNNEKMLDMSVVCSGYMEDTDAPTADQETRRKWVFSCQTAVNARHVGFAIGPFELVELSQFRESEEDDKMGQSAVSVHGFCLPGRSDELRNSCVPIASAIDRISTDYAFYPFESSSSSYKLCFVDDLPFHVVDTATLSICSSRLLVPENVIDTLYESTRELIHAVASQWLGVKITAKDPEDSWIIVGSSYFLADQFLSHLWGKNEHRFRLKQASDRICEMDIKRPSIYDIGAELDVDSEEHLFLKLKAPMVLTILHHRILKANGRNGVDRMIKRLLLDDNLGKLDDGEIDTDRFKRVYEKVAHAKSDAFFNQWVFGAGCPNFQLSQRFNKKKLVVEMTIIQSPGDSLNLELTPDTFMRKIKEKEEFTEQPSPQLLFTGPMTIRIHEADGTPYEHIVDIRELTTKIEIPYNTKYKRLKRNKRQKERAAVNVGMEVDIQDDVLLYCLGDVLQSDDEVREWDLVDWSQREEDAMNNEHYEWIRLDKDFEWIAKTSFDNHPSYMWVSQLQQDNDVVAQVESVQWLAKQPPEKLHSTILVRTLLDARYFYGIRVMAAHALARIATSELDWIGMRHLIKSFQEFFCFDGSLMPKANSFRDRRSYRIQCAIPEALSLIRDSTGRAPNEVKEFFINQLKYNDNSSNEYSDAYYVSTLVSCLARSLTGLGLTQNPYGYVNVEQEAKDMGYLETVLGMIHRYQRIDEFLPSFSNLYTVTALESLKLLMQSKAITRKLGGMLQHTQPANSESVRIKAFGCLIELDAFEQPSIMAYFLASFDSDGSPYFRNQLWNLISRGFGKLALTLPAVQEPAAPVDGLLQVEEGNAVQDARHALLNRLQNVVEASKALRERLKEAPALADSIMDALRSDKVDLGNFLDLLGLCRIIYDSVDRLTVTLKYPQYWKIASVDEGLVKFKKTGRFRFRPYTELVDRWPALKKKRAHAEANAPIDAAQGPDPKKPRIVTNFPPAGGLPSIAPLQTPKIRLTGFNFSQSAAPKVSTPKVSTPPPLPPSKPEVITTKQESPMIPLVDHRSVSPSELSSLHTNALTTLKVPSSILLRFPKGLWSSPLPGSSSDRQPSAPSELKAPLKLEIPVVIPPVERAKTKSPTPKVSPAPPPPTAPVETSHPPPTPVGQMNPPAPPAPKLERKLSIKLNFGGKGRS